MVENLDRLVVPRESDDSVVDFVSVSGDEAAEGKPDAGAEKGKSDDAVGAQDHGGDTLGASDPAPGAS